MSDTQPAKRIAELQETISQLSNDNQMLKIRCDYLEAKNGQLDRLCDDLQAALLEKDDDDEVEIVPAFPAHKSSQ